MAGASNSQNDPFFTHRRPNWRAATRRLLPVDSRSHAAVLTAVKLEPTAACSRVNITICRLISQRAGGALPPRVTLALRLRVPDRRPTGPWCHSSASVSPSAFWPQAPRYPWSRAMEVLGWSHSVGLRRGGLTDSLSAVDSAELNELRVETPESFGFVNIQNMHLTPPSNKNVVIDWWWGAFLLHHVDENDAFLFEKCQKIRPLWCDNSQNSLSRKLLDAFAIQN